MIATIFSPKVLRGALPALSLAILLAAIYYLNPRAISPLGFNLMFNLAVPIALATIAQMCVITVNDLDLSIGAYVGFVVCVAATWLHDTPALGVLVLAAGIAVYMLRRRADLSSQPAVDRRHARHVLRLAGPGGSGPADARRQVAGVAADADEIEAAADSAALCRRGRHPLPDHRRGGHRRRRPCPPDAHLLWLDSPRLRRQSEGDRARRLVAAQDQGHDVRRSPGCSACSPASR